MGLYELVRVWAPRVSQERSSATTLEEFVRVQHCQKLQTICTSRWLRVPPTMYVMKFGAGPSAAIVGNYLMPAGGRAVASVEVQNRQSNAEKMSALKSCVHGS